MKQNEKISVCIPFYNVEPYVGRCLDSVLQNTYKNLEVICVNDGSTDETSAALHHYAKKDPRIVVIDKENGGVVSARKAAINVATGDFVSFIDGDDWIHCQFFEVLMAIQEKLNADAVICSYEKCAEYIHDKTQNTSELSCELIQQCQLTKNEHALTHVWGRIYRRAMVPAIGVTTDITIGEDTALNLLILLGREHPKIAISSEKLYYYFQREGSLVRTVAHTEKIELAEFLKSVFSQFYWPQGKAIVLHEILRTILSYRYLEMFCPNQDEVCQRCGELYGFCANNWNGILTLAERSRYRLLYHIPILYRAFRIITDPTMLDWEHIEKQKWAMK